MDPNKVALKFNPSKSGKAIVATCDEYPNVAGTGQTEEQATASFWRIFNSKQLELEHEATLHKKQDVKKAA